MKIFYLVKWFLGAKLLKRRRPLQSVVFISNECNLRCRHCHVVEVENPVSKTFDEVREDLLYCYRQGSRFVDFEGGEPLLWRDGDKNLNDLISLAKEIGFFSSTVTTNAQLPFGHCNSDSMWISMDGLGKFHDMVRGMGTFNVLEKNIEKANRKALNVNMVINTHNYQNVEETIRYVQDSPYIKKIALNFHTPYQGTEKLFLPWKEREEVIDLIIKMKKEGYPIMNSVSGLKMMKKSNFSKHCWVTNFILPDGTRLTECVGKSAGMCNQCGLCMAGEMHSVFSFKPDTIFAGLKVRM